MNLNNKGISSLNGIEYFSALTSLDCNDNYLESLDVSGLPELDLLDCSNNRLSSLTLGSGLLGVSCNGNQLTELDLSDASSLLLLNCSDNQLTELNIGNNRQLQELKCEDNPIRLVDFRNSSPLKSYCSFPEDTIVVWTDADTGWKEIGDQTYYIVDEETTPKDSHLATGWTTIGGVDYLFTGTVQGVGFRWTATTGTGCDPDVGCGGNAELCIHDGVGSGETDRNPDALQRFRRFSGLDLRK